MNYLFPCGCVGKEPFCSHHYTKPVAEGSDTDEVVSQVTKLGKTTVMLSAKRAKFKNKYNLVFMPPATRDFLDVGACPTHKHLMQFVDDTYMGVIICNTDELAATLNSLYSLDVPNIKVLTSLRALPDSKNRSLLQEFFGNVVIFGNYPDEVIATCIYLGQQCLYEKHLIAQPWVTCALDYNTTSFRTLLASRELNKRVTIKTEYPILFNLLTNPQFAHSTLRLETYYENSPRN